jgi:hypothetical protein
MRRCLAGLAFLLVVGAAGAVWALPVQRTTVAGTVEGLEGRWLCLVTLGASAAAGRTAASLWEVRSSDAGLVLSERLIVLPEAPRKRLQAGGWEPSDEDLETIARGWDTLSPEDRGIATMSHEIFGPDGFDEVIAKEPAAANALWVVRQIYSFAPGRARPLREVRVFAADATDVRGYRGRYEAATVVAAPLPLPVKLEGRFRLLRLAPRSPWSRLADFFRGCSAAGGAASD